MASGSLETDFLSVKSLTDYWSSLAFGSVTLFFGIKGAFFAFFSKTTKWIFAKVFFRI